MTETPDDLADSRLAEQVALGVEALNQLGIPNTLADAVEALQRQLSEARDLAAHHKVIVDKWSAELTMEMARAEARIVRAEVAERQLSDSRAEGERMQAVVEAARLVAPLAVLPWDHQTDIDNDEADRRIAALRVAVAALSPPSHS